MNFAILLKHLLDRTLLNGKSTIWKFLINKNTAKW